MITITYGKEETRSPRRFESCKYRLEITHDIENPEKIEETIDKVRKLVREKIESEKKLDRVNEGARKEIKKKVEEDN